MTERIFFRIKKSKEISIFTLREKYIFANLVKVFCEELLCLFEVLMYDVFVLSSRE